MSDREGGSVCLRERGRGRERERLGEFVCVRERESVCERVSVAPRRLATLWLHLVWGLEFGVWGLGSGVWGLGFGV